MNKKLIYTTKRTVILFAAILLLTGTHKKQIEFCNSVKAQFPEYFKHTKVLDVGSLDINGNNRMFFDSCDYTGIDIGPGPNVDVIEPVHKHRGIYDVVICTNMLEHDKYYKKSMKRMIKLLRQEGLLIITAPAEGHPVHGVDTLHPESSPYTLGYYRNLNKEEFISILNPENNFTKHGFRHSERDFELYFWGIKKEK